MQFNASGETGVLSTNVVDGAGYMQLRDIKCQSVIFVNDSGVALEVRRRSDGATQIVPNGTDHLGYNVANANELEVRRQDQSPAEAIVRFRYTR